MARSFRLKSPPVPLEKHEQEALFSWRNVMQTKIPELKWLFAIPNGLWLPDAYARTALKQGLTAGVCDLALLLPRGGYHGLLIEMKRRDATPCKITEKQKAFLSHHANLGYRAEMVKGWEMGKNLILEYLGKSE